jgi:hypothetical protein
VFVIEINIRRAFTIWGTAFVMSACANENALPGVGLREEDAARSESDEEDAGGKTNEPSPSSTATPGVRDFLVPDGDGDVQITQVYRGDTHEVGDVQATLRATSELLDVYVEDEFWGVQVTGSQLNSFMHRLLDKGVASSFRPDLGVLATDEVVFGPLRRENLPNGKQRVFVVDTSGAGDGYLCGWCSYPDLHLDGHLVAPLDGDIAASISAHELFHGIHRGYDGDEEVWLDETLAEAAMSVNGLFTDEAWLSNYLNNPNIAWGPHGATVESIHYGACLAFGSYLWEQGGSELMQAVTQEPLNGWQGLDAALKQVGEARTGGELFLEMAAALYYDAPERGLGFTSFDLTVAVPARSLDLGATQSLSLESFGLVYLTLNVGGTLSLVAQDVEGLLVGFVEEAAALEFRVLNANQAVEVEPGLLVVSATTATKLDVVLE